MREEEKTLQEIKSEFSQSNDILSIQLDSFISAVAPYALMPNAAAEIVSKDSAAYLAEFTFFRLNSCTTEDAENLSLYLNMKIEKLFTALHPLNQPVIYGVVSRGGRASIVIGVRSAVSETIVKSLIKGLLAGIDVEDCSFDFSASIGPDGKGGFISAVPVLKIDEERQSFDLSTLMRSLNGQNYTVLFYARPIQGQIAQEKYSQVLRIKDACATVSKRNVSLQDSINETSTVTESSTRRGIFKEALQQIFRDKEFDGRSLLDSLIDGGVMSGSVSEAKTIKALTAGTSFDLQNSFALEMAEYCDKAIERLKYGQSIGLWDVTVSYAANGIAGDILEACIRGELAKPAADILPMGKTPYLLATGQSIYLPAEGAERLYAPITSAELGMLCTPPADAVPNFELKRGVVYPMIPSAGEVLIGKVTDGQRPLDNMDFALSEKDLNKHTFVCGITGSGKTTTVKRILRNCAKPFMVIESAKKEYRNIRLSEECQPLTVYTLGKPEINCLQFNPFYVQRGINVQAHIDYLKDLFNASFSFYGPMPYILEKCLQNVYRKKGWNLTFGYHPYLVNLEKKTDVFDSDYMKSQYRKKACGFIFPTMQDLKDEIKRYIEREMQYEGEASGNIKTAILARLESLCVGSKGYMFNTHKTIDMDSLMKRNVVFELEGLSDDSDKAFCVGMLVIFINEFRQVFKDEFGNGEIGLQHLLVIEEAHRLLKNVETERSSENMGNPKGKAVEHFTNMIAEMRSYGQGVIIAEQIPSKLAPDVIKNSSNKIIQRVVSADDQKLVANTIGVKEEDAVYLGQLEAGAALCHKEGMSLPVCVKINRVADNSISDSDLIAQDIDGVFMGINYQMINENLGSAMETLGFRLLNTILASDKYTVAESIKDFKEKMKLELQKKDVVLLPCGKYYELLGNALAELLISLLCNGVYSWGKLAGDEVFDAVRNLCVTGKEDALQPVIDNLSQVYRKTTRNHCILVVSELLKRNYSPSVNLDLSIRHFFYKLTDDLTAAISERVKGGASQ